MSNDRLDLVARSTGTGWKEELSSGRFSGMSILITGAGSGIGLATALRIAREGGHVIAVDRVAERLASLIDLAQGLSIVPVAADITTNEGIAAITAATGGHLDGLVNNAGIADGFTPLGETSDELWDRVMSINVTAPFKLTRALLPQLEQSHAASVVNIASIGGLRAAVAGTAYVTSKHAIIGMTRSASFFYRDTSIRFNAVAPGAVMTNLELSFESKLGQERIGDYLAAVPPPPAEAEQIAASVTFLLSRDATNINGAVLSSDNGWSAM
ncbi:SDR family NAD(P)-dependent oxidoreductase [Pseudomonas sp. NPDC089752]|uniref:SDR family NAD(P)-dependent oxidoreductase n=1 Tax=Pseudomonas sp. NPDC089752 TaxID=3364472 RepID=UPI0038193658